MENLKITIGLQSPIAIKRYTTIDGILLSLYYKYLEKNGKRLEFDPEHKSVNFIDRKNGVFSGSVWFLDKTSDMILDFATITKKVEYDKIYHLTGKKKSSSPFFKQALVEFETMLVDKIHFYIRGDKQIIESLLISELKFIGNKNSLGYGKVGDIEVETIEKNKGFFLNKDIVSKPLPCELFEAENNAVAYFRTMPPYWSPENHKPCYMPSGLLIEDHIQKANIEEYTATKDVKYVDNCTFLYQRRTFLYQNWNKSAAFQIANTPYSFTSPYTQVAPFKVLEMSKMKVGKKFKYELKDDNKELVCCFTKQTHKKGMVCDVKQLLKTTRKSFADYQSIKETGFISFEVLWALENMEQISYSLVDNKKWIYLQGKKSTETTKLNNFIVEPTKLNPPFSINLKDTQNSQHVSFKGRVSISNGFFYIQYGNDTLMIDSQTLKMAIQDIEEIVTNNKNIGKTHLTGNYIDSYFPLIKTDANYNMNQKIIMEFQKKYSRDIRKILAIVKY